MSSSDSCTPSGNSHPRNAGLMKAAERELSAFFNAVLQLFGREQAELSAQDWLRELTGAESLPSSAREWRWITARAASRLATRVDASSLSAEFTSV